MSIQVPIILSKLVYKSFCFHLYYYLEMDFSHIQNNMKALSISDDDGCKSMPKFDRDKWLDILAPPSTDDPILQHKFQQERLMQVLKIQEAERTDTSFSRDCLFCRQHFTGNRALLFEHLSKDHNFHVGAPDNIVFGNELLDVLSDKLKNLQCFYCEKTFKDWMVLKEHMRKKLHKRINPKNKTYDKFYLINYLELGKNWTDVQNEDDNDCEYDDDDELNEEEMDCQDEVTDFLCLFCESKEQSLQGFYVHMKSAHGFDYEEFKSQHKLDFYKQVKFINYIRRQVYHKTCMICEEKFDSSSDLLHHMCETSHISMFPEEAKWNQPMFYFPTYENDNLLCALEDEFEDGSPSTEPLVVPEEIRVNVRSLLTDECTRQMLF